MFEFSLSELLLIAVVALIFIKPEDLPDIMRAFGKFIGKMKGYANEITSLLDEQKVQEKITKVMGDDGKMHIAYDLEDIQNFLKKPLSTKNEATEPTKVSEIKTEVISQNINEITVDEKK